MICSICEKEYEYKRQTGCSKTKCKTCQTNGRRYIIKEKIVKNLGGQCIDCGYKECLAALQPHHINQELKTMVLSEGYRHAWVKVEKELENCELLCANCHAKRHHRCERTICEGI